MSETEETTPTGLPASAAAGNPEIRNIVEAALLVAGQPLPLDRMLALFTEDARPSRDELRAALADLQRDYETRGVELREIDKGWRIQTRARYAGWIARLSEERPVRYSRALLETLAIIAYRQPVTRGEIEEIRGVAVSSEIIKTLMGRDWIRQVGQRDVPGKPALYGTTRGFLEHFNLGSLDELPPLAELRDIEKISAELNLRLPIEPEPVAAESGEGDDTASEVRPAPDGDESAPEGGLTPTSDDPTASGDDGEDGAGDTPRLAQAADAADPDTVAVPTDNEGTTPAAIEAGPADDRGPPS